MNRLRRNALTLVAALLLVCPSACAQGLVVRQPEGAPTGALQDPKGDAELQQEIRALRDQAAQLEALVQQLQQRAKAPQGDERDGPRQDADQDRMRRMEQERFDREQQERKRAAADHIAQVEKRTQDEIARIKQNAQREIERIKAEVATQMPEPRRKPADRSPMFVHSRDDQGGPRQDRGNVQLFEVDEHGMPTRRIDTDFWQARRDESCCDCKCPSCGAANRPQDDRSFDDPEIDRLLEALRNRLAGRRQQGQFRGRIAAPPPHPSDARRSSTGQGHSTTTDDSPDEAPPHDTSGGNGPIRRSDS